jgi:glycosyltransferase involved in cell wall biosynthesis
VGARARAALGMAPLDPGPQVVVRHRVAFIDYFPTHYRRRLYERLAERMEVDFYFYSDERERWWNPKLALADQGDFRRIELRRTRVAGEMVMPGLVPRLTPRRYDAVIKSLNGRLMLPLTYATSRLRGLPFVLWTGMWYHPQTRFHRLSLPLTEAIYRGAAAIVPYGDHVRDFVLQTPGVAPEKVFVAGQAVEPERFSAVADGPGGEPRALFVGQFKSYKGIDELLSAWSELPSAAARLRMVGNGPLEAQVRTAAAADPRIELAGHVGQDRLPAELAAARCLVLPSVTTPVDREPWGLVVNEAMHAGRPVVVTDAVGAAAGGLVRDGRNGLVVPEKDPAALRAALTRLLDDRELAARLGAQARADAAEFTHDRMAAAFEAAVGHAVRLSAGRAAAS